MNLNSPLAQFLYRWLALWPIQLTPQGDLSLGLFWPWQLISYGFLHGGLFHILFNMFGLWMFGIEIENTWGSKRFAIFYFVCVVGAALVQLATTLGSQIPTVGASGGVSGILMAFGMMFPDRVIYINFLFPVKAKWLVAGLIVFSIFSGVTDSQSNIAHFAHLGGMVFGFFLMLYWRGKLPIRPRQTIA